MEVKRFLLGLLLFGCDPTPAQKTTVTTNSAVNVDLLFEHDGCKVYRFNADGSHHYYVRCKDSDLTTDRRSCGEDCVKTEEIPTLRIEGK